MSALMSQNQILEITGYSQQTAQERSLKELGYIVLGRSANNKVRALDTHPQDPLLLAVQGDRVVLDLT